MKHICDTTDGKSWFRLETELEAAQESDLMQHAVERYFREEKEKAAARFAPASSRFIEQEIGLKAHLQRTMPLFLTLRDSDGTALVTAMLPPEGRDDSAFRPIIVGRGNSDPYPEHGHAIDALAAHFSLSLNRQRCYPYRRA
jgi:hypothetical protein